MNANRSGDANSDVPASQYLLLTAYSLFLERIAVGKSGFPMFGATDSAQIGVEFAHENAIFPYMFWFLNEVFRQAAAARC